jgi:hypothetical protein
MIRVIKSRRIRWMQRVARMVKKTYTGFHWAKLKDTDHLEHIDEDTG